MLIDGRPIEEALVLKSGMMITIVPEPPQASSEALMAGQRWHCSRHPCIPSDDCGGRAIREADRKATLMELDAEQEDP